MASYCGPGNRPNPSTLLLPALLAGVGPMRTDTKPAPPIVRRRHHSSSHLHLVPGSWVARRSGPQDAPESIKIRPIATSLPRPSVPAPPLLRLRLRPRLPRPLLRPLPRPRRRPLPPLGASGRAARPDALRCHISVRRTSVHREYDTTTCSSASPRASFCPRLRRPRPSSAGVVLARRPLPPLGASGRTTSTQRPRANCPTSTARDSAGT